MGFLDVLLLKKGLDQLGVDKNALFSDPESYLKANPLEFDRIKPYLLALLLIVMCPIPVILIGEFLFPFDWLIPAAAAATFGVLLSIAIVFIDTKEKLIVNEKGISMSMRGKTVFAPWTFFNQQGQSDLKAGVEVKVPINATYINDVVMTDAAGNETRGHDIKTAHFRIVLTKDQEMVALRNFYPFGAVDMAEMIRRVALTLGHQQPPAFNPPQEQ